MKTIKKILKWSAISFAAVVGGLMVLGVILTITESDEDRAERIAREQKSDSVRAVQDSIEAYEKSEAERIAYENNPKNWDYEEMPGKYKKELAEELLNDNSKQAVFAMRVQDAVKTQFKHPESVDLPMEASVMLENMKPVSWEKGLFRYVGTVSAKNSFGMATNHKYQVDVSIKNKKIEVVDMKLQ